MHYSNEELENFWFQYKTEGEIHGTTLEKFCRDHNVSYKALDNWRRQTRNKIYPVEIVDDNPKDTKPANEQAATLPAPTANQFDRFTSCRHRSRQPQPSQENHACSFTDTHAGQSGVRIMITIKATNGLYISQRNLDYAGVLRIVEKLEGLC